MGGPAGTSLPRPAGPPSQPNGPPTPSPSRARALARSRPRRSSPISTIHHSPSPPSPAHPSPPRHRSLGATGPTGTIRGALTSGRRAAIDEWMRGWQADPPSPPTIGGGRDTPASLVSMISSDATTKDEADGDDIFSPSSSPSSSCASPFADSPVTTMADSLSKSLPATSILANSRSRSASTAEEPARSSAPVKVSVNVSARAAHFNALARAASLSSSSPAVPKSKLPKNAPGFARPTRSSSAKAVSVPTSGANTTAATNVHVASETNSVHAANVGPSSAVSSTSIAGSSASHTQNTQTHIRAISSDYPTTSHTVTHTAAQPTTQPAALPVSNPAPSHTGNGLRPLLLGKDTPPPLPELFAPAAAPSAAPQCTVRKRFSMVPYKAADPAPEDCEPRDAENTHLSPSKTGPQLHHRHHSSLVYKKSTADISPSKEFPRSPSDTTDELSGDPEAFLDASLDDLNEGGSLHERRHNSIVSGNLERRESILRSIVRVENRERELWEDMERRGSPAEPAPIDSTGLRKLSLQGRPARRRASTPCVSTPSPIMDSPVAQLPSPPQLEAEGALALHSLEGATAQSSPRDAAALLSNLEPQVTRETDISSAPTSLGLAGSRSSLLRPASVSTSVATDEEPRVRFATPDEMRATFRRQVHRESTLATLTGPQRSRPEVDILDHDHLASILSKQDYAATITPATSTTNSVASASSVPRYRQRREQEAPAPDYVASAYTGDATAGITESSGFGLGEEEGLGAAVTAPGPTRRCTLFTFCGAGGAELSKLVDDNSSTPSFAAAWHGDVDPLDHLLPDPQAGEAGPGFLETLGRWFCPVDGT